MSAPWLRSYEHGVLSTLDYPPLTVDQLLTEAVRRFPYNTASQFVLRYLLRERLTIGGRLTYRRLNELVDRFATALHHLGVRKGDRVALMLPNSPQFMIAFFAAVRIGAIVVNINPTYTPRELAEQLADSGAETIVMLNLFYPRLEQIQSQTQVRRVIVATIADTLPLAMGLLVTRSQRREADWVDPPTGIDRFRFSELLRLTRPAPPQVERDPNDVALFQYTGGTTGTPKAAMLTHRNLVANASQITAWFRAARPGEEKFMAAVPFFHVYGMTVAMILPIMLGAEIVIVPNPRPIENVMRVIAHERVTVFPGVPAMYIGVLHHEHVQQYDLHSVHACISGSAPLPMDVQEQFERLTNGRLVEGYGLTEAAPVTHCNPLFGIRKSGSIGIPLPDVEARLLDLETGEELPIGSPREGELFVRGPQVMRGYWNRPEESAAVIDAEGWLATGDICRTDADGYFYVVDRKKDMIIASGYKILPREVEEVLFSHPQVKEAAVIGVPDVYRGETVKAFVVCRTDATVSEEELIAFCRTSLAPYKVPRQIEFRDELPKTLVGKVLRRVLVEEEQTRQVRNTVVP